MESMSPSLGRKPLVTYACKLNWKKAVKNHTPVCTGRWNNATGTAMTKGVKVESSQFEKHNLTALGPASVRPIPSRDQRMFNRVRTASEQEATYFYQKIVFKYMEYFCSTKIFSL